MTRLRAVSLGVLALVAAGGRLSAHDIPRDVTVHARVRAQGQVLRLDLRVPIEAMRDMQFPRGASGQIDLPRAEGALRDAVAMWLLPDLEIREEGERIGPPVVAAVGVSPRDELEVALDYAIRSDGSRFALRPRFERLGARVLTAVQFVTPSGAVRAFELRGDPGLVALDPRWHQAAWRFVTIGVAHILDGADHLLFLLCLVVPFRRFRPLAIVVTAFTAAHSIALAAAAFGLVPGALWFPPLVETLIAASIVWMAVENVVTTSTTARRTALAFGFGLVHGFGFSFALSETMQFAGAHLLTSLFAFNLGVEIGQIAVLLVLVPALGALFRYGLPERVGTIVLSVIVGHAAWHWMADRWSALRAFPLPPADAATLLIVVRVLLAAVLVTAAVWGIRLVRRPRNAS